MPPEPIYPPPAPPDLPDAPPNPPQPPLSPFIDPPFVAVGVYVLNAGSDDAYAGYVDLDFLLYTKSFGILSNGKKLEREEAILPGGSCAKTTLNHRTIDWWTLHKEKPPSPPPAEWGPPRSFLANTFSEPSFSRCPMGAVQADILEPNMGVACWRVQGKFTYSIDMVNFPFDVQTFKILLEDESDGLGADYCLLHTVSGLSSEMMTVAERITWSYQLKTKCYPPYVTCVNGTEESCQPLAQQQATADEECEYWKRYGVPDGATKRHQVLLSIAVDFVYRKVLLRYFLVPLCSIFIMMSTYALDPVENLNARYTVSSGLLISTILFHVQSVMKATSHTSKLSYFDMMMMLVYVINAVTVQFNVVIFLIDRRIVRIDRHRQTEAYRSEGHKLYMKAINDAVFCMVLVGTLVGLIGLFTVHSAYWGLGIIFFGPPVVGFAVHCYCWNQLPGNQGPATGGLSRKLRWRLRHNWRRMRGKVPEYAPFGDDELQGADLSLQDALVMAADDDSGEQVELHLLPEEEQGGMREELHPRRQSHVAEALDLPIGASRERNLL